MVYSYDIESTENNVRNAWLFAARNVNLIQVKYMPISFSLALLVNLKLISFHFFLMEGLRGKHMIIRSTNGVWAYYAMNF